MEKFYNKPRGDEGIQGPEFEVDPKSIAVVTSTYYPKWYHGELKEDGNVDKIRGDLALRTIEEAQNKGFQIILVDGGDNSDFKTAVAQFDTHLYIEVEKGMSERRQMGFNKASTLDKVKVICWTEPEKAPFVRNGLLQSAVPVLKNEADIVVVERNKNLFKETYPDYQVKIEEDSIQLWNAMLRKYGLRSVDDPDIDAWFGPRCFRNDPEIIALFTDRYIYEPGSDLKLKEIIKPELWPNALYFPLIAALHKGLKVLGVEVPYRHPEEQTVVEQSSNEFRRKRKFQQENIVLSSELFIKYLLDLPSDNGRIKKVS